MATLEGEIVFLLAVTALLDRRHVPPVTEEEAESTAASPPLSAMEAEVLAELLLLEKHNAQSTAQPSGSPSPVAEMAALLTDSPLAATYTGETSSPYTRFLLSFYSSALYARMPTKVNTAAVRLFQRFLCCCSHEALRYLQRCGGIATMDAVLTECLNLAGNVSSTVQVAAPSSITAVVLGELEYDAHEVSPLDYLDVLLPHIPYLSQMCQQAALLLLAHEEMLTAPSSLVVLVTILFTIRNMGGGEGAVSRVLGAWTADQQEQFYRMDAFLNRFT